VTAKTYRQAVKITQLRYEFNAVIMAAMLNSDETNYMILSSMFPAICEELKVHYFAALKAVNAPTVAGQ
jgi:hypothetical protein